MRAKSEPTPWRRRVVALAVVFGNLCFGGDTFGSHVDADEETILETTEFDPLDVCW